MDWIGEITQRLGERLPDAVAGRAAACDLPVLHVARDQIVDVCRFLRDEPDCEFRLLVDLTAVDWLGEEPRFEVVYQLMSLPAGRRLMLSVRVPADDPRVETVTPVWRGADWLEREVFDLMGVSFDGHPDLRRIQLADDWEGHPLRKDYPLEGHDYHE